MPLLSARKSWTVLAVMAAVCAVAAMIVGPLMYLGVGLVAILGWYFAIVVGIALAVPAAALIITLFEGEDLREEYDDDYYF